MIQKFCTSASNGMFLVAYISNLFFWGDYINLRNIPVLPDLGNASEGTEKERKRVLVNTKTLSFSGYPSKPILHVLPYLQSRGIFDRLCRYNRR
jgi:hypothetical protein